MYKIYFLIIILSFFVVKGSHSRTYADYYNAIYSKEISVLGLEDLKNKLVENGLNDTKAVTQVLYMNGIDEAALQNLNSPKKIFIPVTGSEYKKKIRIEDQNKTICNLLSPSDLEKKNRTKISYRTYHDYLYSRAIPNPQRLSIKDLLIQDAYSYPDLKRWAKITRWMNKEKHAPGDSLYLPPCQVTPKPIPTIALADPISLKVTREKVEKKTTKKKSRRSYFATAMMGQALVEANDDLNSNFDLVFLKIGAGINYHLTDYTLRAGVAINSYLFIKFNSDSGSGESNDVKYYLDFLIGINKAFGKHSLTIQYDNLNYLISKSLETEVNLEPTRVDRISLMDALSVSKKISLTGSVGFFPGISSDTSGYEYGLGLLYHFNKAYSLNANFIHNKINMQEIENTSKVFVVGGSYRF